MSSAKISRLQYIDWVRGIAAVIMLQGHAFHSFVRPELRNEGAYVPSQFVGGMPPAIFLFLTGVTLAFLMSSSERKGVAPGRRVLSALRRAGYLFALAFAFRIQMWLFGLPHGSFWDIFRVDILNCMGLAILAMSVLALLRSRDRARTAAVFGVAIAAASPIISMIDWSFAPEIVRNYLVPDYNYFSFFPWAAFLAFGVSAGTLLRQVSHEQTERVMQWTAIVGGALILTSQYFANLPYSIYPKSEFWLNSPALIFIKLGVILVMLPIAYLWTNITGVEKWSWIRQFGTTSLLVYWVHIELVYGRWLWFWKESLDIPQTAAAAVAIILVMLLLSTASTNWSRWRAAISEYFSPAPRRVPGD